MCIELARENSGSTQRREGREEEFEGREGGGQRRKTEEAVCGGYDGGEVGGRVLECENWI